MKRKILTLLLALCATLCLCFGLAACDGNGGTGDNGQNAEQGGSSGGNTGDTEQGGSSGGNTDDTEQGGDETPTHTHVYDQQLATDTYLISEATCTEKAVYYYSCTCGEKGTETFEYGNALGHTEVSADNGVAATCTEAGKESDTVCLVCGETLTTGSEIPATGHTEVSADNGVAATCTEVGKESDTVCSVCGETLDWGAEIPATGHTEVSADNAIAPTCTEAGKESDTVCSVCGETLDWGAEIPATGHNYVEGVCTVCEHLEAYDLLIFTLSADKTYYSVSDCQWDATEVTIPSTYNDKPVKSIGDDAFEYSKLNSITIPNSVTSIGESAFWNCTSLTSIDIPDGVTSIGFRAFDGCTSLTSIDLSDSLTSIGRQAFYGCTSLTSIDIPGGVTSIGVVAFYNCTSLESVTIGSGVTSIGEEAFSYCTSLTNITIPDSVTSIGLYAFSNCNSLKYNEYDKACYLGNNTNPYVVLIKAKDADINSCSISNNTKVIYEEAFRNCRSLTSITIPNSVTSIGYRAFLLCSVTSVTIGSGVTSIEEEAFYGSALTSVTIPDGVTNIGEEAFASCDSLTSITVNENNANYSSNDGNLYNKAGTTLIQYAIGKTATSFTIPNNVTSIGSYAFEYSKLESVTISNDVTSIGYRAFLWCFSLASVTIGSGVTSIGDEAFLYCSALTSITIPNSVTNIGEEAFASCTSLTSITVCESNANYKSIDGNLYSKDGTTLIQYAAGKTATSFTIPNDVTNIGIYAFAYCTNLTSITISVGVTDIEDYAFQGCYKLIEVYNLSSLEITAGSDNNGLVAYYAKNVYKTESGSKLSTSGDYIFYNDTENGNRYYLVGYTGNATSLTLPDKYNGNNYSIYQYAFYDCTSLEQVIIGSGVTSIGDFAFNGGGDILLYYYYKGSAEDWKNVTIGVNYNLYSVYLYYYSAENPFEGESAVESGNYWHYDTDSKTPVAWTKQTEAAE